MAERFCLYSLFKQYYQGDWQQANRIIRDTASYLSANGRRELVNMPDQDISVGDEVEFDYNRLFIGPAKLLAPPFESAYRNDNRLVMQRETLAVRAFYRQAGLEVQKKNAIPDDHLGLELEFICYLLAQTGSYTEQDCSYAAVYQDFFQKHVQQWVYRHCDDVKARAETPACRGVAEALTGFLRSEEREIANGLREGTN